MPGPGRPAHQPTAESRSQVEALTAFGITQEHIAAITGISVDTLVKHYRSELDLGVAKATARVASNLFKKATGEGKDSAASAMFWLKTRAQWRETVRQEVEHSGVVRSETVDLSGLNADQLRALASIKVPAE